MTALTKRERQMQRCVAEGLTNRAIAERFSISGETVKRHLSVVFRKLGVSTRLELAMLTERAQQSGIRAYRCGACATLLELDQAEPAPFKAKYHLGEGLSIDLRHVCPNCIDALRAALDAALARLKLPATPDQP